MKALVIVFGVLAALAGGVLGLFTVGEIPAVLIVVVVAALVVYALTAGLRFLRLISLLLVVAFIGVIAYGGYSGYSLYDALSGTDGPVDPADPAALASANAKLDEADGKAGFRIEMTAEELTAVLQDAMTDNTDNPLKRVDLTIVDGSNGGQGHVDFTGKFKNGGLTVDGSVTAKVDAGRVDFSIQSVDLGAFTVPGVAKGAVESLIETITDLNKKLKAHNADVQALQIGGGKVVVIGVSGGGDIPTLGTLLDAVQENVQGLGAKATPPAETLGPGAVDSTQLDGTRYYVALGDSLAANVGVASPKDGYVSRFLKQLDAKDSTEYGLRNFGVSGQTSSGMINNGQLDAAVDFLKNNDVAYVTIDIGANDLLGHLYSADCSDSLETPACKARLDNTIPLYSANLDRILTKVHDAAPKATIIFLGMYNPFSIGFGSGVPLEGQTDAIVDRVNGIAQAEAAKVGAKFANGQSAIQGRAGAVTHMLEQPPDIHPRAIGYDLLAATLVAALK